MVGCGRARLSTQSHSRRCPSEAWPASPSPLVHSIYRFPRPSMGSSVIANPGLLEKPFVMRVRSRVALRLNLPPSHAVTKAPPWRLPRSVPACSRRSFSFLLAIALAKSTGQSRSSTRATGRLPDGQATARFPRAQTLRHSSGCTFSVSTPEPRRSSC